MSLVLLNSNRKVKVFFQQSERGRLIRLKREARQINSCREVAYRHDGNVASRRLRTNRPRSGKKSYTYPKIAMVGE